MEFPEIYSASGLMELIQQIGFLPLLDSGIVGFSAEEIVDEDRPKKLSMRIVGMLLYPKVDGNGHYGNGRERL